MRLLLSIGVAFDESEDDLYALSFLSFCFFLDWFCRFEKIGEPRFCVVRMNIRVCVNFLVVCNI